MDYRFGPFRLDTTKRRLWRGDELVPLTTKAFDTLVVLVVRAGTVVEKDDILKAVWPDTFVEEATLAQNISTLRKALVDTSETPTYIATVPRRGYRFLERVTEVRDAPQEPTVASPGRTAGTGGAERLWMAVAGVLALGIVVIGIRAMQTTLQPLVPVAFAISPPEGTTFSTSGGVMAVSPDGRHVVFIALSPDGTDTLWLRSLDSLVEHVLPGTEGASQPFWSSDSRFVAFFAGGKLKKVGTAGGPTETICDAPIGSDPLAGTWNNHGDILFSLNKHGIFRVPAGGGSATPVIPKSPEDHSVAWPQFLPDGRHFLFVVSSMQPDRAGIYVGALDSTERTRIAATRSYATYAPSGYLLFIQDGTLVAQPFDAATFQLTDNPVPVAQGVAFNAGTGRGTFSLSQSGVLAYRTVANTQLVWFDRDGKSLGPVGSVGGYLRFSVSPDNTRVAAARLDPQTGTSDIWVIDGAGGRERRLTFDTAWENTPLWSPDAATIAFSSDRNGRWEIYEKPSAGSGADRLLVSSDAAVFPQHWLPDERLLLRRLDPKTNGDFWVLAPRGDAKPVRLPYLDSDEDAGRISPDGRWLAYIAYDSEWSVSVRPIQSLDRQWRVGAEDGADPKWRADGRELFYLSPDLSVMAVDIEPGSSFRAGPPRRLFQTQAVAPSGLTGQAYDVTSDGQRFLVKVPASFSPITVIVNWSSMLQNRR